MISVVYAICKVSDLKGYLNMSNSDIKRFGDITIVELMEDCKERGAVIVPFRG